MKTAILLIMAMFSTLVSMACTTCEMDTLIVKKPNVVKVVATDSLQTIIIEGQEDNPQWKYENTINIVDSNYVSNTEINDDWSFSLGNIFSTRRNRKSKDSSNRYERATNSTNMHFALGFCSANGLPGRSQTSMYKSLELWWTVIEYEYRPWGNGHEFSVGWSLDWRNYRITENKRFLKGGDGMLSLEDYPENSIPKFSRIKVFSHSFPLQYGYEGRQIGFSFGPVLNFNAYSSVKTRYKLDDRKYKDVQKDIHVRPVTVDLMAKVCVDLLSFYVKYSPVSLIAPQYGLTFKTLSFGVYF